MKIYANRFFNWAEIDEACMILDDTYRRRYRKGNIHKYIFTFDPPHIYQSQLCLPTLTVGYVPRGKCKDDPRHVQLVCKDITAISKYLNIKLFDKSAFLIFSRFDIYVDLQRAGISISYWKQLPDDAIIGIIPKTWWVIYKGQCKLINSLNDSPDIGIFFTEGHISRMDISLKNGTTKHIAWYPPIECNGNIYPPFCRIETDLVEYGSYIWFNNKNNLRDVCRYLNINYFSDTDDIRIPGYSHSVVLEYPIIRIPPIIQINKTMELE